VSTPTAPITAIIFLIMGKDKPHWIIFIALPTSVLGVFSMQSLSSRTKIPKDFCCFGAILPQMMMNQVNSCLLIESKGESKMRTSKD